MREQSDRTLCRDTDVMEYCARRTEVRVRQQRTGSRRRHHIRVWQRVGGGVLTGTRNERQMHTMLRAPGDGLFDGATIITLPTLGTRETAQRQRWTGAPRQTEDVRPKRCGPRRTTQGPQVALYRLIGKTLLIQGQCDGRTRWRMNSLDVRDTGDRRVPV